MFSGAFAKLRKVNISFVMFVIHLSVRPSVRRSALNNLASTRRILTKFYF